MSRESRSAANAGREQDAELDTTTQFKAGDLAQLVGCCGSCIFLIAAVVAIAVFFYLSTTRHDDDEPRQRVDYSRLLLDSLDRSLDPCDNFFRFVCSGWIRNHQKGFTTLIDALEADTILEAMEALDAVPVVSGATDTSARFRKGVTGLSRRVPKTSAVDNFTNKRKNATTRSPRNAPNLSNLRREKRSARASTASSAVQKAASMFRSCKEIAGQTRIENENLRNFLPIYTKFPDSEIEDADTIVRKLVELSLSWKIHLLFKVDVFADHDEDAKPTLSLSYNEELEQWLQLRNSLADARKLNKFMLSHMESIADLGGQNTDVLIESITKQDTKIITRLFGNGRNVDAVPLNDLPQIFTGTTAKGWLNAVSSQTQVHFNVSLTDYVKLDYKDYFREVGALLGSPKPEDRRQLSLFLGWHIIRLVAPLVSHKAVSALYQDEGSFHKACFSRVMEEMPLTTAFLNLVSEPKIFAITETMVTDIRAALARIFKNVGWMDDSTRSEAVNKLEAMEEVLLYPRFIGNDQDALDAHYSDVEIFPDFFSTRMAAASASTALKLKALAQGEKADNYAFQPLQINAFYERPLNTMFIPAGIIRPPFANENLSWSFNFAGLGAVVGHEVMHGFDTEGRRRDSAGARRNWWSRSVEHTYNDKVKCIRDAYNAHDSTDMAENVADFASLPAVLGACRARSFVAADAEGSDLFGEFTWEQQFFLNYCFKLCSRATGAAEGYATDEDRCNVPLRNLRMFATTFGCERANAMDPANKCNFWDLPV